MLSVDCLTHRISYWQKKSWLWNYEDYKKRKLPFTHTLGLPILLHLQGKGIAASAYVETIAFADLCQRKADNRL